MNNEARWDELKAIRPLLTSLYDSRSLVISVSRDITKNSKKM